MGLFSGYSSTNGGWLYCSLHVGLYFFMDSGSGNKSKSRRYRAVLSLSVHSHISISQFAIPKLFFRTEAQRALFHTTLSADRQGSQRKPFRPSNSTFRNRPGLNFLFAIRCCFGERLFDVHTITSFPFTYWRSPLIMDSHMTIHEGVIF